MDFSSEKCWLPGAYGAFRERLPGLQLQVGKDTTFNPSSILLGDLSQSRCYQRGEVLVSPVAVGSGFLAISHKKEFSETRTGGWVIFLCMELNPWVSKAPFTPVQSQKMCRWGFSSPKIGVHVPSLHALLEPGPVQHQAGVAGVSCCNLIVHCLWGPRGCGPHGQVQGSQERAKSTREK